MRRKSSILTGDSNPNDAFDLAIEWEAFPNNTLDGLGLYDATFDHTVPFNLVISEIMYDPNGSDENWEWIEVYNPNDVAVDLSGYILDDENGTAHNTANITSGIIAAKNTAILYDGNNTDFAIAWGSEINLIPVNDWSKMTLNNNGDKVSLWSNFLAYSGDHQNHTNTVDTVDYSGVNFPDSAGASIYLKDLTTDNNDGNNWVVSIDRETTPTGTGFTDQVWGSIGSPGGNFAPNTTDKTVTVAEDNSYTFQVSDFGFNDINSEDTLQNVKITQLETFGTLKLNGVEVTLNQEINASDLNKLTFTPAENDHGNSYDRFQFQVSDGKAYSTAHDITIYVTAVDDQPQVQNAIANIIVDEDAANQIIDLSNVFTDIDNDDIDIIKTLKSNTNTELVQVNLSDNILILDFQDNQNGVAEITIEAISNSQKITDTFTVTVNAINDAPTNIILDHTQIAENYDGGIVGNLTTIDLDSSVFTYHVDDIRFEVVDNHLKLKLGEILDFETESTINLNITAIDDGSPATSFMKSFSLSVENINEEESPVVDDEPNIEVEPDLPELEEPPVIPEQELPISDDEPTIEVEPNLPEIEEPPVIPEQELPISDDEPNIEIEPDLPELEEPPVIPEQELPISDDEPTIEVEPDFPEIEEPEVSPEQELPVSDDEPTVEVEPDIPELEEPIVIPEQELPISDDEPTIEVEPNLPEIEEPGEESPVTDDEPNIEVDVPEIEEPSEELPVSDDEPTIEVEPNLPEIEEPSEELPVSDDEPNIEIEPDIPELEEPQVSPEEELPVVDDEPTIEVEPDLPEIEEPDIIPEQELPVKTEEQQVKPQPKTQPVQLPVSPNIQNSVKGIVQQPVSESVFDPTLLISDIFAPIQPIIPEITNNSETQILTHNILLDNTSNNLIIGSIHRDILTGNDSNNWINSYQGDDIINTNSGDDTVYGGKGDDTLFSLAGNNWLNGNEGADFINGGEDTDTLFGEEDTDTLQGNAGDDWLSGNLGQDFINGGEGNDTIFGGQDNDTLQGSFGNDEIFGNVGFDLIEGNEGDDWLSGGEGNDTISGNDGNDTLYGDEGDDLLDGNAGDDLLNGGSGDDTLDGGTGNDILIGDRGDDWLFGAEGSDTLTGGTGRDKFVIGIGQGSDIILDFEKGEDIIILDGLTFAQLTIEQVDKGTAIQFKQEVLLTLDGIESNLITSDDFTSLF